jgi:hypothetical protein
VASANVSSGESRDAAKAIAWHPDSAGLLLLGTESGERGGWAPYCSVHVTLPCR